MANVEYIDNGTVAVYNGYKFNKDKRTGYYLSTSPINGRRRRLHRYVWETENGRRVPVGYDVHHVDKNKDNNDISNLVILTRSEHQSEHQHIMSEDEIKARAERVVKYMIPKAIEWHKSEEGRKWHVQHGRDVAKKLAPVKHTCTFCGKEYLTKNRYRNGQNTFCSNKCKSAYRRALGVDNTERKCKYCGKIYSTNKYSPALYCPEHRDRKYRV